MTTNPEEHDFIQQVCTEDDAARVPPRLSQESSVNFKESAELVAFHQWHGEEYGYVGATSACDARKEGWLACARYRYNESTMQGEEE